MNDMEIMKDMLSRNGINFYTEGGNAIESKGARFVFDATGRLDRLYAWDDGEDC